MLGFGHQFLPPTINQNALRISSGNLAKFAANRRASSRVRRSGMSGIGVPVQPVDATLGVRRQ
jgi:hypothetical protein